MTKLVLTDNWLKAPQAPGDWADRNAPSLKVRVGRTGVKTFAAVRWRDGRAERTTFGRYPEVSLKEARRRAEAYASGAPDPESADNAEGAAASDAAGKLPVTALFEDYIARMKRREQPSVRDYEIAFYDGDRSFVTWLVKRYGRVPPAGAVTSDDAASWLRERQKTSTFHARYMRAYLHAAFQWGLRRRHDFTGEARDYGLVHNPIAALPTGNKSSPRDRVLSVEELRAAWQALTPSTAGNRVLKLIIAMGGLRVTEISQSEKSWWGEETLRLPTTKNRRSHEVPITASARPVLDISRQLSPASSRFLFPIAADKDEAMTLTGITKSARNLRERFSMEPFTPRDLRRTMKTHLIERGVDERWLDIWHNHGQTAGVARKHYIRAEYAEKKQKVAEAIDAFLREQKIAV